MGITDITYSCGHKGRVQIYGPTKDRPRKVKWYEKRKCKKCFAAHIVTSIQDDIRAEFGFDAVVQIKPRAYVVNVPAEADCPLDLRGYVASCVASLVGAACDWDAENVNVEVFQGERLMPPWD